MNEDWGRRVGEKRLVGGAGGGYLIKESFCGGRGRCRRGLRTWGVEALGR